MHDLRRHHWLQLSIVAKRTCVPPWDPAVGAPIANHRRQLWLLRKEAAKKKAAKKKKS